MEASTVRKKTDSNSRDVLTVIFNIKRTNGLFVMKPSVYNKQMVVSTEERIQDFQSVLRRNSLQIISFSPSPEYVLFQNYELDHKYTTVLKMKNVFRTNQDISVQFEATPEFEITFDNNNTGTKIAPGLSFNVFVHFCAKHYSDYNHSITFITEKGKMTVEFLALAPRGIVNFPDSIVLKETTVKRESIKCVPLKNISKVSAFFHIQTESPFSVDFCNAQLMPGTSMMLTVKCLSNKDGDINGKLMISCEDDIYLDIDLFCHVCTDKIYLAKDAIYFDDTFISLKTKSEIILYNKSNNISHFSWKKYESLKVDNFAREKLKDRVEGIKDAEELKSNKMEYFEVLNYDQHKNIYERIYRDEIDEMYLHDMFPYTNSIFSIYPMEGDILPNNSMIFTIIFSPENNQLYETKAFLEVIGVSERLPVYLKGTGIGPEIVLNVKQITTGRICIDTTHLYAIIACNRGLIAGTLFFGENELHFGGTVECDPNKILIEPDKQCLLTLQYAAKSQGKFAETLEFFIGESGETVKLYFEGEVYVPILELDVEKIDLGDVPYGYTYSRTLKLINNAEVPIPYCMSAYRNVGVKTGSRMRSISNAEYFSLNPKSAIVNPHSVLESEVSIYVCVVGEKEFFMKIIMWDSPNHVIVVPIKYNSSVPHLTCIPTEINIPFCFINYPYQREFQIINLSKFPGKVKWYVFTDEEPNTNAIDFNLGLTNFTIDAEERIPVTLTITTKEIGLNSVPIYFKILGSKPMELIRITCNGQGPVVSFDPNEINFHKILLLQKQSKLLNIISDSPIPTDVVLTLPKNCPFSITPEKLRLEPQETVTCKIKTYLVDPGVYFAKLITHVDDKEHKIPIKCVGFGTSISVYPLMDPNLDLNYIFTRSYFTMALTFTNEGNRFHKLIWTTNKDKKDFIEDRIDETNMPTFLLEPSVMSLDKHEKCTIKLKAHCQKSKVVQTQFYCFAIINNKEKEMIMQSLISATFIDPTVELSKNQLNFLLEVTPTSTYSFLTDVIELKNIMALPIHLEMSISGMFVFDVNEENNLTSYSASLQSEDIMKVRVSFVPGDHTKRSFNTKSSFVISFKKHIVKTIVNLYGYVSYPTISIEPNDVQLDPIPVGSDGQALVVLSNISSLPVTYSWLFDEDYFKIMNLHIIKERPRIKSSEVTVCPSEKDSTLIVPQKVVGEESIIGEIETVDFLYQTLCLGAKDVLLENDIIPEELESVKSNVTEVKLFDEEVINYELKNLLFPLVKKFKKKDETADIGELIFCQAVFKQKTQETQEEINVEMEDADSSPSIEKILSVEPFEGHLKPYESCVVRIGVRLQENTRLHAVLKCVIEGGEIEELSVKAECVRPNFALSTANPSLGRQVFTDPGYTSISIENYGYSTFQFNIFQEDQFGFQYSLEGNSNQLKVSPNADNVEPGSNKNIQISFIPGFLGEFREKVYIEVGSMKPFEITVEGCGVFKQVFLPISRSELMDMFVEESYYAIGSLTSKFLSSVKSAQLNQKFKYTNDLMVIPPAERTRLKNDGWELADCLDMYPTLIDIEMALERTIAFRKFHQIRSVMKTGRSLFSIPGLEVARYVFDMGCTLINTTTTKTFSILNYGPGETKLKITSKNTRFNSLGLNIKFKTNIVKEGKVADFVVIFTPTKKIFPELEGRVETQLELSVFKGANIPVTLVAEASYPKVGLKYSAIDFGTVHCGDVFKKSIIIFNNGKLPAQWSAHVEELLKSTEFKSPFYININNGTLDVGGELLLDIFFRPRDTGPQRANLVLEITNNTNNIITRLCGYSLKPTLVFSEELLKFPSTLPYFSSMFKTISIQNVSSFPVELVFADYDSEYEEENFLIELFLTYYHVNEVLIPHRAIGDELPMEFYHLNSLITHKYMSRQEKILQEILSRKPMSGEDAGSDYSIVHHVTDDKMFSEDDSISLNTGLNKDSLLAFARKTSTDKNINSKKEVTSIAIEPVLENSSTNKKDGILIVFHGHPETETFRSANKTGIALGLPVYSIDRLIFEALVMDQSPSIDMINQIIDFEFNEVASATDLLKETGEDEYETLEKKVQLLLTDKEKKKLEKPNKGGKPGKQDKKDSKKGSKASKASKGSKKSKASKGSASTDQSSKGTKGGKQKKKPSRNTNTLMQIPPEVFLHLLEMKLQQFPTGIIVESLQSNFIKNTGIALNCLLKASGNLRYIHFILLSYSYRDYEMVCELKHKEEEERIAKQKAERLEELINMEPEELKMVSPAELKILDEYYARLKKERDEKKKQRIQKQHLAKKTKSKKDEGKDKNKDEKKKGKDKSEKKKDKKSGKSSKTSKKDKKEKKKLTPEEQEIKKSFEEQEELLNEILHTLEYWDRKNVKLTKPYISKKKAAKKDVGRLDSVSDMTDLGRPDPEELGIPCWFINKAFPNNEKQIPDTIAAFLPTTKSLQEIKEKIRKKVEHVPEENEVLYSILCHRLVNDMSINFLIGDVYNSQVSVHSVDLLKKVKRIAHKKMDRLEKISTATMSSTYVDQEVFNSRVVLDPGEIVQYKIKFISRICGTLSYRYRIAVKGCDMFYFDCEGLCEIPEVNLSMKAIFKAHAMNTQAYLYDEATNTFDFGEHIPMQEDTILQIPIYLENTKDIKTLVALHFEKDNIFSAETLLELNCNENKKINLRMRHSKTGSFTDTLYFAVENNPTMAQVLLKSTIIPFEFVVSPDTLRFEDVNVGKLEEKQVRLINNCKMAIQWKFVNIDWATEIFDFSQTTGYILGNSENVLTIQYLPKRSEVIQLSQLTIELIDFHGYYERPFYYPKLFIFAESINVSLQYENKINFGNIKGGQPYNHKLKILNSGKMQVRAVVEPFDETLAAKRILKMFTIKPNQFHLYPNKPSIITVTLTPTSEICLEDYPIYRCLILQTTEDHLCDSFVIYASCKSYMSSFELDRIDTINFGHIQIGTKKSYSLDLKNTGEFDMAYVITTLTKFLAQKKALEEKKKKGSKGSKGSKSSKGSKKSKGSKESKKSSKVSKKSKESKKGKKEKKKKIKITKLQMNGFQLVSSTGTVDPGETYLINIETSPTELKVYEETVVLTISPCLRKENNGWKIKLLAIGCEPEIQSDNPHAMFREGFVIENSEDFNNDSIGPHCVYVISENALYFKMVKLNMKQEMTIHLLNKGLVPANVSLNILQGDGTFRVNQMNLDVESYEDKSITVSFTPKSVDEIRAILEISYNAKFSPPLKIMLVGEGILAELKMLDPPVDDRNECTITFNPTVVGFVKVNVFTFANTGRIPCKAIVELVDRNAFILKQVIDNEGGTEASFSEEKYDFLVNLEIGESVTFQIIFSPKAEDAYETKIKIHIVENIYDRVTVYLYGEGYYNNVIIEGLKTIILSEEQLRNRRRTPSRTKRLSINNMMGHLLDFGFSALFTIQKQCIKIKNLSSELIFKFKFTNSDTVEFIPTTGHLKPNHFKEVVVTCYARAPIDIRDELLKCTICEILYMDPEQEMISWDDRQTFVSWNPEGAEQTETNSSTSKTTGTLTDEDESEILEETECRYKHVTHRPEPEFSVIPKSELFIPILLSVNAGYATYECNVAEIKFTEVFISDFDTKTFEIRNTSLAPLEIKWSFNMDDVLPKKVESIDFSYEQSKSNVDPSLSREKSSSTLFSSEDSLMTSRTWSDQNVLPFTISPEKFTILPEESHEFTVKYTPTDVLEYLVHLKSSIENLDPQQIDLDIIIIANGCMPEFYFEMPVSNFKPYGLRKCSEFDWEKALILEFEAVGLGISVKKKFNLVNPQLSDLNFMFKRYNNDPLTFFACLDKSGTVSGEKKYEITIIFTPQEVGTFEDYYFFTTSESTVSKPLLLVGTCREPKVYFYPNFVKLKPTIKNIESVETILIKNEENVSINFQIEKDSLKSENLEERLTIEPKSYDLSPSSEMPLVLKCKSTAMGVFHYNILCYVERRTKPINLHVTSNCVALKPIISYYDKENTQTIINPNKATSINIGVILPRTPQYLVFNIRNEGKTALYYNINLNNSCLDDNFKLFASHLNGLLPSETSEDIELTLEPVKKANLNEHAITIAIPCGPTYQILLSAVSNRKQCKFSFDKHDFGDCLIQKENSQMYSALLEVTNKESYPVLLECASNISDELLIDFTSKKLESKEKILIPIYFNPILEGLHTYSVIFTINSTEYVVKLTGNGVKLNIEANEKYLDFYSVKIEHIKKRIIYITNQSLASVKVSINLIDKLPFNFKSKPTVSPDLKIPEIPKPVKKEKKESAKSSKKGSKAASKKGSKKDSKKSSKKESKKGSKESSKSGKSKQKSKETAPLVPEVPVESHEAKQKRLLYESIGITPNSLDLGPRETKSVEIRYRPMEIMNDFTEKLYYQVQELVEPLCVIRGSVASLDYAFDKDFLVFGKVYIGCRDERRVLLKNNGNCKGKFMLKVEDPRNFSIRPDNGIIHSKAQVAITITFDPKLISKSITTKLVCEVDDNKGQLYLPLHGYCENLPEPREILIFKAPVREEFIKTITLKNETNMPWNIKPILLSKHFKCPKKIIVQKFSSETFNVVYRPLEMALTLLHNVPLFLPLPHGDGIMYKLSGTATAPLSLGTINKEIYCKTSFTEYLSITNWLGEPQFFTVTTMLTSPITTKTLYKVSGSKIIDLQSNATKEYQWSIYVVNEGPINFRVTFTNEETKEYIFYEIYLKVLPGLPLENIILTTCVREPANYFLQISNPVDIPITYNVASDATNLFFEKSLPMEPYTTHKLHLEYKPIKTEKVDTILKIFCEQLGSFTYEVHLSCLPPVPEQVVKFKTNLGETCTKVVNFYNRFNETIDFQAKFDHPMFYAQELPTIAVGQTGQIIIVFDPIDLEDIQSKMILTSGVAGNFIYPLVGECDPPRPKGPLYIQPGQSIIITFKNPFMTDNEFLITTQNPQVFFTKTYTETIKAKKTIKITLFMETAINLLKNGINPNVPICGKLIISCNTLGNMKWVYYLQNERR